MYGTVKKGWKKVSFYEYFHTTKIMHTSSKSENLCKILNLSLNRRLINDSV